MNKPVTNEELIVGCQRGDLAAFRRLVEANQSYGYALAYRLLGECESSRDVVQESMIRVWKHIHQLDAGKKFTTWYYRIVVNLCYDRLKARMRERKKMQGIMMNSPNADDAQDPETLLLKKEWRERVKNAAGSLSPKQKLVFVLRDLQELSIEEVRKVTGMSAGAIKSNLYHARKAIRKKLA